MASSSSPRTSKKPDSRRGEPPHLTFGVLGPPKSGKSALLNAFINETFISDYDPLIYQTFNHPICVDGDVVFVTLHDTSGYGEFWAMTEHLLCKSDAFMLCFSVADRSSLEQLELHYEVIHKCQPKAQIGKIPILVVGCQSDVPEGIREVPYEEVQCIADSWGVGYIEVSAKEHRNVVEAFHEMAKSWQRLNTVLGDGCTRGALTKAGDTGALDTLKSRSRWFVLNGSSLKYYEKEEHESKGKSIAELNLSNAVWVDMDEEKTFKLDGPGLNANKKDKAYVFTADTEEEFMKWKVAIAACIKNCKEAKEKRLQEDTKVEKDSGGRRGFHRKHKKEKEKKSKEKDKKKNKD